MENENTRDELFGIVYFGRFNEMLRRSIEPWIRIDFVWFHKREKKNTVNNWRITGWWKKVKMSMDDSIDDENHNKTGKNIVETTPEQILSLFIEHVVREHFAVPEKKEQQKKPSNRPTRIPRFA